MYLKEEGDLIEINIIVKFGYDIKRYIITAVDIKTKYLFAYGNKDRGSNNTKDFFKN